MSNLKNTSVIHFKRLYKHVLILLMCVLPFWLLLFLRKKVAGINNFSLGVAFCLFVFGMFYFFFHFSDCFVDEEELRKQPVFSLKIEFCNLSVWDTLFQCVTYPLARITLYEDFFVIVVLFRVYKFFYEDIESISIERVKLFHNVIAIKMRKPFFSQYYLSTVFKQKRLYQCLTEKKEGRVV